MAFLTAISINNALKEGPKTVELFKWLDTHNQTAAKQVYSVAEKDLIAAGEYAVCGRYLEGDRDYQQILAGVARLKAMPKSPATQQILDVANRMFAGKVATLVAVLAINHRNDEAERVASHAAIENNSPEFAALLAEAKNGIIPPQSP
jgi:hypothetical protein